MTLRQSLANVSSWFDRHGLARHRTVVGRADKHLIDFQDLVNRYSFAEHAARADRYFGTLDLRSPVARKPFASPHEAADLCAGIANLLPGLLLFPGARVLDFGAGTCWMSRVLALLRCEVTAVDVSRKALEVGERLIRSDALGDQLSVEFVPLDGPELPFEDESFDRVVCFDALHHVPNQHGAIREFARVLRNGGIAALHEPGPTHSRSSQSQYEMRMYDVVEADVHVERLIETAYLAGFSNAELAVYNSRSIKANIDDFNLFLANPRDSSVGRRLNAHTAAEFENRRTFFLQKGNPLDHMDSRSSFGLLADIDIVASVEEGGTRMRGVISNSGSNTWRPSFSGSGGVNIGVHLHAAEGKLINADYARFAVSSDRVSPGQHRAVEISIPHPSGLDRFELVIDLVSEGVMWFEIGGGTARRFVVELGDAPSVERIV
jgi:ubiquinone/menaquinone biosynthesis C-methylase UbiE